MNILLIPDAYSEYLSGGKVARYMTELIRNLGYNVNIFIPYPNEDELVNLKNNEKVFSFYDYGLGKRKSRFDINQDIIEKKLFKEILVKNKIDVIHFCSHGRNKKDYLIKIAKENNVKMVSQLWMHDFYCLKTYNFCNNKECNRCAKGNFTRALFSGCIPLGEKLINRIIRQYKFKKNFMKSDVYLTPSKNIGNLLLEYGIPSDKIINGKLFFDSNLLIEREEKSKGIQSNIQEYYVYYGQNLKEKGYDFLKEFSNKFSNIKIKTFLNKESKISNELIENFEEYNDISWENGLMEYIKNSKAILIPSMWSSTTEYALLEALFFGKPVVVFNVGVHKEILIDKENALVSNYNDTDDFYKKILLLEDEEIYNKISINAKKTFDEITNNLEYKEILKSTYQKLWEKK